jgi:hypothetical protein
VTCQREWREWQKAWLCYLPAPAGTFMPGKSALGKENIKTASHCP